MSVVLFRGMILYIICELKYCMLVGHLCHTLYQNMYYMYKLSIFGNTRNYLVLKI